jgi:integrase/recombinase XerD
VTKKEGLAGARNKPVPVDIAPASQEAIERFCDACWLEDGLAQNSLSAYRRDLLLLAQWLYKQSGSDCVSSCR